MPPHPAGELKLRESRVFGYFLDKTLEKKFRFHLPRHHCAPRRGAAVWITSCASRVSVWVMFLLQGKWERVCGLESAPLASPQVS